MIGIRHFAAAGRGRSIACAAMLWAALVSPLAATAATKMGEGFASRYSREGPFITPLDRIDSGEVGQLVIYWIQWKEHPAAHSAFRCTVTDDEDGSVIYDNVEEYEDSRPEGYSACGFEFEEGGNYTFAQYVNDEKVGEAAIAVTQPSFWKELWGDYRHKSVYRQFKWALGLLAGVVLGVGWIVKKRRAAASGGDPDAAPGAGIVIGARVDGAIPASTSGVATARNDAAEELRKCGLQYEVLAAQPDRLKALEAGRRYLGLLVKARETAKAVEVFKACVAVDANFRPERAEDVFAIAKAARAAGETAASVAVLRGFDKLFPAHALVPEMYVFSAKVMAEDLRNPVMARKILEYVVQKYPGHFIAQEAKKYLEGMPQTA